VRVPLAALSVPVGMNMPMGMFMSMFVFLSLRVHLPYSKRRIPSAHSHHPLITQFDNWLPRMH